MQLDQTGENLIKGYEKLCLSTYFCPAGKPTIGWGHTGPDVHVGMTITPTQAEADFLSDTQIAINAINKFVKVPLTQGQFNALVSLVFNVGVGVLIKTTLINMLNAGNYVGAGQQFLRWDHIGNVESSGLENRRVAELNLWKGNN